MAFDEHAQALIRTYQALKTERGTWERHWQDIIDVMRPQHPAFTGTTPGTPGEKRTAKMFDVVPALAAEKHAAVLEAAVIPVPDTDRGQEVKACLVLQPGLTPADLPAGQVFAHCAAQLARFKVPRFLEYREALPKTPSQKIAKHLLIAERADLRAGAIDRLAGVSA